MPAQKKTSLGLNQWIGSEYPKRIDFVEDNKIINDELENRVKYTDLATETVPGIITYAKIKEIAPKPDLSPYIPFSKGYRNTNNSDYIIRANATDCWTPRHIYMYLENGDYMGCFHVNGGRAYYKVPGRAGGGWCEIMDNHDMVARDIRMNNMDTDRTNLWNKANDAWNKAHDAQVNRIYEIRLAGYVAVVIHQHGGYERAGYVVTGVAETTGDYITDIVQMRALQFNRNGQWINTPFV
jgi:hypothetical protein|nr:MAG TPA: hypothetical protein [Caudoviricetes sp.]